MEKIAILADSGCQIPVGSRENEGIFIAPLTITMEGKSYLDDIEIHSIDKKIVLYLFKCTGNEGSFAMLILANNFCESQFL